MTPAICRGVEKERAVSSRVFKPEVVLVAVAMLAGLPAPAAAYLDPGAGSMFIQGVVATLAAVGYALRLNWSRIRAWFGRRTSR